MKSLNGGNKHTKHTTAKDQAEEKKENSEMKIVTRPLQDECQATNKQTNKKQTAHGVCWGMTPTQMGLPSQGPECHKNHIQVVPLTCTYAEKGSGRNTYVHSRNLMYSQPGIRRR